MSDRTRTVDTYCESGVGGAKKIRKNANEPVSASAFIWFSFLSRDSLFFFIACVCTLCVCVSFSFSACDSRAPEGRNKGETTLKKTSLRACAICKRHASLFLARCATSAARRTRIRIHLRVFPPSAIFFSCFRWNSSYNCGIVAARSWETTRELRAVSELYAGWEQYYRIILRIAACAARAHYETITSVTSAHALLYVSPKYV